MSRKAPGFIAIYTDGACSGNPGPGGWGAIVLDPQGRVTELGGPENSTTNNRMEMMATVRSLRSVASIEGPVQLFTDSTYVIRGITQWIWGWRKKGWKTAEGAEVQNRELWEDLLRVVTARGPEGKIEWIYVRGHTGNPGNERCDRIAVAFSQGRPITLYRGTLENYGVDILEFPEVAPLPEMRPKEEKVAAYSYVSVIDGVPQRHRDWPSCERRVKGRSGAKFKKAKTAGEESEILKAWGIDPKSIRDDG